MGEATKVISSFMPSQYATEGIYRIFYRGTLTDVFIWLQLGGIILISFIIYVIGLKLYDK